MNRFIGSILCLGLLFGVGCASKTVLEVGKYQVGGRTAAHAWQGPSATQNPATGETRFTLGFVSVGFIGRVGDQCTEVVTLQSSTGDVAVVDSK